MDLQLSLDPLASEPPCAEGAALKKKKKKRKKENFLPTGVSVVAQQLTNPTSIHEDTGLIPALAQWVKDQVLL